MWCNIRSSWTWVAVLIPADNWLVSKACKGMRAQRVSCLESLLPLTWIWSWYGDPTDGRMRWWCRWARCNAAPIPSASHFPGTGHAEEVPCILPHPTGTHRQTLMSRIAWVWDSSWAEVELDGRLTVDCKKPWTPLEMEPDLVDGEGPAKALVRGFIWLEWAGGKQTRHAQVSCREPRRLELDSWLRYWYWAVA